MKKRVCTLMILGAVAMGMVGCGLLPEEEMPTAPVLTKEETDEYKVATVARSDIQVVEEVRATYIPAEAKRLGFKVGDEEIAAMYVQVGDQVKEGDVLAELDVSRQREQLRQEQEQVDDLNLQLQHLDETYELNLSKAQMEDEYARQNGIADWKSQAAAVSKQYGEQRQLIQNSLQLAQMRLDKAKKEITDRQIIADFDGMITRIYEFKKGELVQKGKDIITLADMDLAMFEVYSENRELLESGQTYTLKCGQKEYEVVAKSAAEVEIANAKEDGMYLSLVIPELNLEAGTKGSIWMLMEESKNTLCVPLEAVHETENGYIVYGVDELGFRTIREVKIGIQNDSVVEIVSGLEENDVVIVD